MHNKIIKVLFMWYGLPWCLSGKESTCQSTCQVWSLTPEGFLEKGMPTHSSVLAWRIPRTEKLGRLQHGVAESDMTEWLAHTHMWYRNICKFTQVHVKRSDCIKFGVPFFFTKFFKREFCQVLRKLKHEF